MTTSFEKEIIVCYMCYESEEINNQFVKDPQPCLCKGSIVIHKNCLELVLKNSRTCSICKTKYNLAYLPTRDGLELIVETTPNGNISEYTLNIKGKKHGTEIIKKQSGQIISKCTYINGLINGEYKTWYSNGQLECICNCIDNRIEGEYKFWYETGILMDHSYYKDGLKDGQSKQWTPTGKLRFNKIYKEGEIVATGSEIPEVSSF